MAAARLQLDKADRLRRGQDLAHMGARHAKAVADVGIGHRGVRMVGI